MAPRRPVPVTRGAGDPAVPSDELALVLGDGRYWEQRLQASGKAERSGPARRAGPVAEALIAEALIAKALIAKALAAKAGVR